MISSSKNLFQNSHFFFHSLMIHHLWFSPFFHVLCSMFTRIHNQVFFTIDISYHLLLFETSHSWLILTLQGVCMPLYLFYLLPIRWSSRFLCYFGFYLIITVKVICHVGKTLLTYLPGLGHFVLFLFVSSRHPASKTNIPGRLESVLG